MFSLCKTIHISHEHHQQLHEVIVTPKSRARASSNHIQNQQQKTQVPKMHSSKKYNSMSSYLKKNRKGIAVLCKELDVRNADGRIKRSLSSQELSLSKNGFVKIQLIVGERLNKTARIPFQQMSKLVHDQKTSIKLIEPTTSQFFNNECIDPFSQMNVSSPSLDKSKPTNISSWLYSTRHAYQPNMHPHLISIKKTYSRITDCQKTQAWSPSGFGEQESVLFGIQKESKSIIIDPKQSVGKCGRGANNFKVEKQKEYLKIFKKNREEEGKTKQLFDAVSIFSFQTDSLQDQNINIEESILINRDMDNFIEIAERKTLKNVQICLALQRKLKYLVSLKIYLKGQEQKSMQEINMHKIINNSFKDNPLSILSFYQILTEGGINKRIIFVQQAYEQLLIDWIQSRKQEWENKNKIVEMASMQFAKNVYEVLAELRNVGIYLLQELELQDFVRTAGKYKFHSLNKFRLLAQHQRKFRSLSKSVTENLRMKFLHQMNFYNI